MEKLGFSSTREMAMREVEATRIKTYVLKVHINCQGCRDKVKKLVSKINGVFSVKIDLEEQLVTISGMVNPEIVIRKLASCGKRAELLSSREAADNKRDIRSLTSSLSATRNGREQIIPTLYGAQAGDNIGTRPWMGELGPSFLNARMPSNRSSLWDHSGISSGTELQGICRGYGIDTGNYKDPNSSSIPSYGYPSFLLQAGSEYNYSVD